MSAEYEKADLKKDFRKLKHFKRFYFSCLSEQEERECETSSVVYILLSGFPRLTGVSLQYARMHAQPLDENQH